MDYMKEVYRMFRPGEIQKELDDYNRPVQENRSIDDCLDSTDALTQWALRKAPQFDPENRQPIPSPSVSPLSDYDIEFTQDKTNPGQSSLSNWSIPIASNTSLSVLNNGTPRENVLTRKSSNLPRLSGNITPSLLLRHKQSIHIGLAGRKSQPLDFAPPASSTPIRAQRKRTSIFENLAGAEENAEASVQHETLTNNKNASTPNDATYQKVTRGSQVNESELTLVPAAKSANESVIPETQQDEAAEAQEQPLPETEQNGDVSSVRTTSVIRNTRTVNANASTPGDRTYRKMTQGSQIDASDLAFVPATQPSNSSVVAETQDDPIPETQEEQVSNTARNSSDVLYTPTRSQRKRSSRHNNISDDDSSKNITDDDSSKNVTEDESSENNLMKSISQLRTPNRHDPHQIDGNTMTLRNGTYRKSTLTNQIDDDRSILVPETQPANESVIPETQDDQIPETQEEQTQETEQNVSTSNARASQEKRDTLTNKQKTPIPTTTNKLKRNPVVLLSPLRMDEMRKIHNIEDERPPAPMDLVITPPRNFQNSRRTSHIENDDLIVEASPSTCAQRIQQLERQNFDQPDADQSDSTLKPANASDAKRKKGRRKSKNQELSAFQIITTSPSRQSLPRNSRGRRLTSFERLRNGFDDDHDIEVEQEIAVTPTTSTSSSDQSKSGGDENVFKVPEVPRRKSVRKSKADNLKGKGNQSNDSIAKGNATVNTNPDLDADADDANININLDLDADDADANTNGNENASASRRASHDSFDFSVHRVMNDSSVPAYMSENDASLPSPPKASSTKNKAQKPKTAAKATPKRRPRRVQNAGNTDDLPTLPRRRQSRDCHYSQNFLAEYLNLVKAPTLASKRKLKSTSTAPVTNRRAEQGPPKKKLRTEPQISHKTKRPTDVIEPSKKSGKSMTSNKTKSKPNRSSTTTKPAKSKSAVSSKSKSMPDQPSSSATTSIKNGLAAFVVGLDEKRLKATEFWKDINDYDKDNEILGEDVLYIKTKEGTIEASTHKQIEYVEIEGVKYGFVPSKNKRFGLMRFQPGAKKAYEKSTGVIILFVLQGCFDIRGVEGEIRLEAASQTVIQNGVFYEITNKGKKTGIIQFEYREHCEETSSDE